MVQRRAILLRAEPEEGKLPVEVVDVSDKTTNPYEVAKELIGDWAERVRTSIRELDMFVDDTGQLKRLPYNVLASAFYPGPIAGDAVLFYIDTYIDSDGPNIAVTDIPDTILNRLLLALVG